MPDAPPPDYAVIATTDTGGTDEPPSYYNVASQIKTALKDSQSPAEFAQQLISIICGSCAFTVILIISAIFPLTMVFVGSLCTTRCPIDQRIPLWLVAIGAIGLAVATVKFAINMISCLRFSQSRKVEDCFCDPTSQFYCNRLCYLFSFWLITCSWVFLLLMGMFLCGICCLLVCVYGCADIFGFKK